MMDMISARLADYIAWTKTVRDGYDGLSSADVSTGDTVETGPIERLDSFDHVEEFSHPGFIDDVSVTGFRSLLLQTDGTLGLRSRHGEQPNATLTYRMAGDYQVSAPSVSVDVVSLANGSRVVIGISQDGDEWQTVTADQAKPETLLVATADSEAYSSIDGFYIRLELAGDLTDGDVVASIDNINIRADLIKPDEPKITLRPSSEHPGLLVYEDDFKTRKYLLDASAVVEEDNIEWYERGMIGTRMKPGGSRPVIVWKAVSDMPLRDVVVRLDCEANEGRYKASNYLDISLDGDTWLHRAITTGLPCNRSGWTREALVVDTSDDADFEHVDEFYVRLRMIAPSYEKEHRYRSSNVHNLRIEAKPAEENVD